MTTIDKKALYESIMKNVAIEVKKYLVESATKSSIYDDTTWEEFISRQNTLEDLVCAFNGIYNIYDIDIDLFDSADMGFIWFEDNDNKIKSLIYTNNLENKVEYLHNSYCVYNGLTIFGTPYVKNLVNWAFYSPNLKKTFSVIDNCDILITHQPPNIDKVGCSYPYLAYERNFGSDSLREVLDNKSIKVNICGHIHSGVHDGVKYVDTTVYNVSLLNENYTHAYNVTYFEI